MTTIEANLVIQSLPCPRNDCLCFVEQQAISQESRGNCTGAPFNDVAIVAMHVAPPLSCNIFTDYQQAGVVLGISSYEGL